MAAVSDETDLAGPGGFERGHSSQQKVTGLRQFAAQRKPA
jgi:hypothetical protein